MENIKAFEIMQNGNKIEIVEASSEREALCIYLMKHEEMEDVMLWRAPYHSVGFGWRLAEYDDEDNYMIAIEIK